MEGNITPHFTWKEILASGTADKLVAEGKLTREQTLPNEEQQKNIIYLFENVIEPIRVAYGKPMRIHSTFRALSVNTIIGGSKNSDHMCAGGRAACDLEPVDDSLAEDFSIWLWKNLKNYPIRQTIWEFPDANGKCQWQHIASDRLDPTPDYSLLIAVKEGGITVYKPMTEQVMKKYNIG